MAFSQVNFKFFGKNMLNLYPSIAHLCYSQLNVVPDVKHSERESKIITLENLFDTSSGRRSSFLSRPWDKRASKDDSDEFYQNKKHLHVNSIVKFPIN